MPANLTKAGRVPGRSGICSVGRNNCSVRLTKLALKKAYFLEANAAGNVVALPANTVGRRHIGHMCHVLHYFFPILLKNSVLASDGVKKRHEPVGRLNNIRPVAPICRVMDFAVGLSYADVVDIFIFLANLP